MYSFKRFNCRNYVKKIPQERMDRKNEIFGQVMFVFFDGSMIQHHPIIGVGANYVGNGSTWVESKKLYVKYVDRSVYVELTAVAFSLSKLPDVLYRHSFFIGQIRGL